MDAVQRITGRWAISWQVIVFANLITYPQMVLTGGTLGSRQMPAEDIPVAAVVMGVAVLANAAYGTLAMVTVFRHRAVKPVPLRLYVGFYLSAGIIPVLGMEYLDSVLGKQTALPVGLRLFFACLTTLWLGVIFSLLLEGRDRFRRERAALLDEAIALRRTALEESESTLELRRSVAMLVDERLSDARDRLDEVLVRASTMSGATGTRDDLVPVVAALESTAAESVRPLSHQMWEQAEAEFTRPRASRVFAQMWRDPRFMPGNTALITAVGLPGVSVRGFGAWAPLAITIITVVVWIVLLLANRALASARSVAVKRVVYGATVLAVLSLLIAYSIVPGDVTTPGSDAGSIIIAFIAGVLLVSYVQALGDVRRLALASIRAEVSDQQLEAEARREALVAITREVARELHGSVQTRLVACAAAIEQAQRSGDTDMVLRALDESARVMAQLRAPEASTEALPLGVRIDQLVAQWSAVCPVEWDLDPSLEGRADLGAVAEIVEEGLANAYRHGEPDLVTASITAEGDDILVEVRDDGRGPMGGGPESSGDGAFRTLHTPGLGLRLIDAHTGGRCTLERAGDWTILTARVSPAVQG